MMNFKRVSEIHKGLSDFLNRHAVAAHICVLPLSVFSLVVFLWIRSSEMSVKGFINELNLLYSLLLSRAFLVDFIGKIFHLFGISFFILLFSYFLFCHALLLAYRWRRRGAFIAIVVVFASYVGLLYAHGWYCERSVERVRQHEGENMPVYELIYQCGLPLSITVDNASNLRFEYGDGKVGTPVYLSSLSPFANANVWGGTYLWLD